MNSKTILSISVTAIFAVSMIFAVHNVEAAKGTYLDIVNGKAKVKNGQLSGFIVTGDKIPQDGSAGAFGYGIITATNDDGNPENVIALTTHLCASDSPVQGAAGVACEDDEGNDITIGLLRLFGLDETEHNDEVFHPHVLDLKTSDSTFCIGQGAPVEVDIGRTVGTGNNVSPTDYELKVKNNKISVAGIPINEANANISGEVLLFASYEIVPNADEDGLITELCLINLSLTE